MKLHLGCGARVEPGWINYDMEPVEGAVKHDLCTGVPVPDGSVTHIFSEHFFEHLTRQEAKTLLTDCYRALATGGIIRIAVPDLYSLVIMYLCKKLRFAEAVGWLPATPAQLLNEGMRFWGHQFLYDLEELLLLFQESGFSAVAGTHGKTEHAGMIVEGRPFLGDIVVEAVK